MHFHPVCHCGTFAIGYCSACRRPICRLHGGMFRDRLLCDGDLRRTEEAERGRFVPFIQAHLDAFLTTMDAAGNPGQNGWPGDTRRIFSDGRGWYLAGSNGPEIGVLKMDGTLYRRAAGSHKVAYVHRDDVAAYLAKAHTLLDAVDALRRHLEANGLAWPDGMPSLLDCI